MGLGVVVGLGGDVGGRVEKVVFFLQSFVIIEGENHVTLPYLSAAD